MTHIGHLSRHLNIRPTRRPVPSQTKDSSCPHGACDGGGAIFVFKDGAQRVQPCTCLIERRNQQVVVEAGIPPIYRNATLDGENDREPFQLWDKPRQQKSQARALAIARRTFRQFMAFFRRETAMPQGLFLYGPHGTGKSRLACSIAVDLAHAGIRKLEFLECDLLPSRIAGAITGGSSEAWTLEPLFEANLLILDDFNPGESPYPQKLLAKIALILSTRFHHEKPTVITSNHNASQQKQYYGPRLLSRLHEYCRFHYLDCGDYRLHAARELTLTDVDDE